MDTMTAAAGPPSEEARLADFRAKLAAQVAAASAMSTFKVNDVSVFDTTAEDLAHSAAEQAHALCIVTSIAIDDSTDAKTDSMSVRPVHLSRSLDAIATLISLSMFARQAVVS